MGGEHPGQQAPPALPTPLRWPRCSQPAAALARPVSYGDEEEGLGVSSSPTLAVVGATPPQPSATRGVTLCFRGLPHAARVSGLPELLNRCLVCGVISRPGPSTVPWV